MDGDIAGMLRQMMENPQFGNMMQAVKSQVGDGDGTVDPAKMMEKLPEMMKTLGPMLQGMMPGAVPEETAGTEKAFDGKKEEAVQNSEKEKESGGDGEAAGRFLFRPDSRDKRNKLLAALKPYLSPARCAIVDRAMSAMQLGEILGMMAPSGKQEGSI